MSKLEMPVNANERYLYAVCTRLDVLIDQLSGITEFIASQQAVPVDKALVEGTPKPARRKRPVKAEEK